MNTLRQDLQHYLSMRRGLGFRLREAGNGLADFVGFLEKRKARYITRELALAWAQQPQKVQSAEWARRLGFVRGFARYRSATDPRTEVPPQGLLPFHAKRARPYIYSDAEIRSLLHAVSLRGRQTETLDVSLFVRAAQRCGTAHRRSTQP
jgi:hypothetical protein